MESKVQALQSALELCIKEMCKYCRAEARMCDLPQCLDGCDTLKIAQSALALPLRNCDVGTEEEQERRYERFCDSHKWVDDEGVNACLADCPLYNTSECALHWAQMTCESAEGGAK